MQEEAGFNVPIFAHFLNPEPCSLKSFLFSILIIGGEVDHRGFFQLLTAEQQCVVLNAGGLRHLARRFAAAGFVVGMDHGV